MSEDDIDEIDSEMEEEAKASAEAQFQEASVAQQQGAGEPVGPAPSAKVAKTKPNADKPVNEDFALIEQLKDILDEEGFEFLND